MLNRTFIRLLALILVLSAVACRLSGELPFLTGLTQDAPPIGEEPDASRVYQLLQDPTLVDQGVRQLLAALGIGIYTADGQPIQSGSDNHENQFFLYDFNLPMLESLVSQEQIPFTSLVLQLNNLGIPITEQALRSLYQQVYADQADRFLVQLLATSGFDPSHTATITPLQEWLLLLDTIVPPNQPAQSGLGGHSLGVFLIPPLSSSGLISGSALSGWGYVYGAADYAKLISAEAAFRQVNAVLFRAQLQTQLTAQPESLRDDQCPHPGHASFDLQIISHWVPSPIAVTYGYLSAFALPGVTSGPLAQVAVTWHGLEALEPHGSLSFASGTPYSTALADATDQRGTSSLLFHPSREGPAPTGETNAELVMVTIEADIATALLTQGVDAESARLIGSIRQGTTFLYEWHDFEGHVLVEGEAIAPGVSSQSRIYSCHGMGGGWYGELSLEYDLAEVSGTLVGYTQFLFGDNPQSGDSSHVVWQVSGTLHMPEGVTMEYNGEHSYEVFLFEDANTCQWRLVSQAGTSDGQAVVHIPGEGSHEVPFTFPFAHTDSADLKFVEDLPECFELPLMPLTD